MCIGEDFHTSSLAADMLPQDPGTEMNTHSNEYFDATVHVKHRSLQYHPSHANTSHPKPPVKQLGGSESGFSPDGSDDLSSVGLTLGSAASLAQRAEHSP
jgi:hypothetical protein